MRRTRILMRRALERIRNATIDLQALLEEDSRFTDYTTYLILNSGVLNIISIVDDIYEVLLEEEKDGNEEE